MLTKYKPHQCTIQAGNTPLHLASSAGQVQLVEYLLNKGANVCANNQVLLSLKYYYHSIRFPLFFFSFVVLISLLHGGLLA